MTAQLPAEVQDRDIAVFASSASGEGEEGELNTALVGDSDFGVYAAWLTESGDNPQGGADTFVRDDQARETQMQSSGSASYSGGALGWEIKNGERVCTFSDFSATVDFDASSMTYASSETHKGGYGNPFLPASDLDFTGSASITGTDFSGAASTTGGDDGSVDGDFVGDQAQWMGGAFSFEGGSGNAYWGAFGADATELPSDGQNSQNQQESGQGGGQPNTDGQPSGGNNQGGQGSNQVERIVASASDFMSFAETPDAPLAGIVMTRGVMNDGTQRGEFVASGETASVKRGVVDTDGYGSYPLVYSDGLLYYNSLHPYLGQITYAEARLPGIPNQVRTFEGYPLRTFAPLPSAFPSVLFAPFEAPLNPALIPDQPGYVPDQGNELTAENVAAFEDAYRRVKDSIERVRRVVGGAGVPGEHRDGAGHDGVATLAAGEYSVYGWWEGGVGYDNIVQGVGSFGAKTPTIDSGVPDFAVYRGASAGYYNNSAGEHETKSALEARVDFSSKSIALRSAGTMIYSEREVDRYYKEEVIPLVMEQYARAERDISRDSVDDDTGTREFRALARDHGISGGFTYGFQGEVLGWLTWVYGNIGARITPSQIALEGVRAPALDFIVDIPFDDADFEASLDDTNFDTNLYNDANPGDRGSLNGSFYGPAAEEIGGIFHITKSDGGIYAGAFGGSRDPFVAPPPPPPPPCPSGSTCGIRAEVFSTPREIYFPPSSLVVSATITADGELGGEITASAASRGASIEAIIEHAQDGRIHGLSVKPFPSAPEEAGNDLDMDEELTELLDDLPALAQGGSRSILASDNGSDLALAESFEFSSFGAWMTDIDGSGGSLNAGSFGAASAPEDIEAQSGSATYTGRTAGFQVDSDKAYATTSNFEATVDFDNDSVSYESSDTHKAAIMDSGGARLGDALSNFTPDSSLDFNGTAAITGAGFAASDDSLRGVFYGDAASPAQEIGGEFSFSDKNYFGSFGAEQDFQ